MDKDNKYYVLIENLVKNNKKFKGYEAILDDIIDDVFSHSQVVLNSVENEDVVKAYLAKVVSTSIITVPKKMNFHKKLSSDTVNISSILKQIDSQKREETQSFTEESNIDEVEKTEKANTEYVDKMINMADTADRKSDNEDADLEVLDDIASVEVIDDINDELENDSEELNLSAESSFDSEIAEKDGLESIDVVEENESVEDLFLDYENNEPEIEKTEAILTTEESNTVEDSIEEPESYIDAELLLEDENIEFSDAVEETDVPEANDFEMLDIDDTYDKVDELDNNNSEDEVQTIDSSMDDGLSDQVSSEEAFIEEVSPIEDFSGFDDNVDLSLNDDRAIDNLDDFDLQQEPLVDSLQEFEENPVLLQNEIEERVDTDLGEQEADTNDAALLQEKLSELSSEYPDLEILDVCKLKYQENYSVEEVAKKLNLPEESVVKALNKVLELL